MNQTTKVIQLGMFFAMVAVPALTIIYLAGVGEALRQGIELVLR